MSAKTISEYKIGDELFRHVEGGGTFRYLVQGIRTYGHGEKFDDNSTQLEVECQTCSHGWKCRVLLAQDDFGRIVVVHMLNEDEDDRQRHWHTNDGLRFWPTAQEAREEGLKLVLRRVDERIREAERRLQADRTFRAGLAAAIGGEE